MKITTFSILTSIVGLTALFSAAGPSLATPLFVAKVETCDPFCAHQEVTAASFVSTATNNANVAIPFGLGSVGARALAGPGRLGASSSSTFNVTDVSNFAEALDSTGTARLFLDDIIISGLGGTVPTSLNLVISGTSTLNTSNSSNAVDTFRGEAKAESSVRLSGFFSFGLHDPETPDFGGTLRREDISYLGCDVVGCVVTTESSEGIFAGFTGAADVSTPIFNATPVGVPFSLDMELSARSFVLYGDELTIFPNIMFASSATDFAHTVSFPTAGPVFNLPAGYTANSVSGLIVNNQWTGGAVAPVPEPSSLLLMVSGLAGLIGFGWRKRRVHQ